MSHSHEDVREYNQRRGPWMKSKGQLFQFRLLKMPALVAVTLPMLNLSCIMEDKTWIVDLNGGVIFDDGTPVPGATVSFEEIGTCCSIENESQDPVCTYVTDEKGLWNQQFFTCVSEMCSCKVTVTESDRSITNTIWFKGTEHKEAQPIMTETVTVVFPF